MGCANSTCPLTLLPIHPRTPPHMPMHAVLVGVPFTPVPGARLLVKSGPHAAAVRRALADALKQARGLMAWWGCWAVVAAARGGWGRAAQKQRCFFRQLIQCVAPLADSSSSCLQPLPHR